VSAAAAAPAAATSAAVLAAGGRIERPLPRRHPVATAPAPAARGPRQFPGELPEDFESVLAAVLVGGSRGRQANR
jgi:hypothetical protein